MDLELVICEGIKGQVDASAVGLALDQRLKGAGAGVANVVVPEGGERL